MLNRYAGTCEHCNGPVAAKAGTLRRVGRGWQVAHLACADEDAPAVTVVQTSGGTFYQNRRGRCEDAPCCGCCTF